MGLAYLILVFGIPLAMLEMLLYEAWDRFMMSVSAFERAVGGIGDLFG